MLTIDWAIFLSFRFSLHLSPFLISVLMCACACKCTLPGMIFPPIFTPNSFCCFDQIWLYTQLLLQITCLARVRCMRRKCIPRHWVLPFFTLDSQHTQITVISYMSYAPTANAFHTIANKFSRVIRAATTTTTTATIADNNNKENSREKQHEPNGHTLEIIRRK